VSLSQQIKNAFPVLPIPSADDAIERTYMVEHLHELLGGRRWTEPSVREYRMCDDGFSLLTVTGLHYYLPGYLQAELTDPETADVIAECVTYTLTPDSDFSRSRVAALGVLMTAHQCAVLAEWLVRYEESYGADRHTRASRQAVAKWQGSSAGGG
jgi:hypothetical protein